VSEPERRALLESARRLPADDQAEALPPILERLSGSQRRPLLEEMLDETSRPLRAALAQYFLELPGECVVEGWTRSLNRAKESGAVEVLGCVRALGPAIVRASGSEALAAKSIHDALRAVDHGDRLTRRRRRWRRRVALLRGALDS
jgi:hypothetical protein